MRENLLGYLLGALDGPEQQELQKQLDSDPQLQQQLQSMQGHVDALSCSCQDHHPPQGLALRVCEAIGQHAGENPNEQGGKIAPGITPASATPAAQPVRWTMADMLVAAGIFLAAALLFFPAVATSHRQAQLAGCQNNLRQLGVAMRDYSQHHDGYYPRINSQGPRLTAAGLYAPLLADKNLADSRLFICQASDFSKDWRVPRLEELRSANGRNLIVLMNRMGGSYAYPLGYMEESRYRTPRYRGRVQFAILSDAPNERMPGRQSSNHGRCGQNVLFDDLHIQYVIGCIIKPCGDDLFVNRHGKVAAGVDVDDSVLGGSSATPFSVPVSSGK